jgi:hypothetical protein
VEEAKEEQEHDDFPEIEELDESSPEESEQVVILDLVSPTMGFSPTTPVI